MANACLDFAPRSFDPKGLFQVFCARLAMDDNFAWLRSLQSAICLLSRTSRIHPSLEQRYPIWRPRRVGRHFAAGHLIVDTLRVFWNAHPGGIVQSNPRTFHAFNIAISKEGSDVDSEAERHMNFSFQYRRLDSSGNHSTMSLAVAL